jgi:chromosome segregation ATPase
MLEIERLLDEVETLGNALRTDHPTPTSSTEGVLSLKSQRSYEAQINKLQVELTQTQITKKELEKELITKISALEDELEALEAEAEDELEAKEKEMQVLIENLVGKDARIAQLESQHNQICSSINDVSTSRQDEMEELQAELIAMTSKTSAQAREIQSLRMKCDELEARKDDYEKKLKSRIHDLEEEIADVTRNVRSQDVEHLRGENNKLRDAVRELKLERVQLKDRLDALASDKSSSKSAQVLRERNIVLKDEVEKLTKRLKKMEASITRFAI